MSSKFLEVECKLSCDDDFVLDELLDSVRAVAEVSGPRVIHQDDRYYDTHASTLAKAGLSARCRHKGRSRAIQIKPILLIPGITFVRPEIEASVPARGNSGLVIRETLKTELGLALRGRPVEQVCVRTRREVYEVTVAGCRAELCHDSAVARLPSRRTGVPFSEVELELVEGKREAFARLAETLVALPTLFPSQQSKYVRARKLHHLGAPRFGAPVVEFEAADPADLVARRIAAAQLAALQSYEPGTRVGLDPEHLHKMRVATRRLRAALATFSDGFTGRNADFLVRNFRWLAAVLGQVRDLDVHLLDLATWRSAALPFEEPGWSRLEDVLDQRRQTARAGLLTQLDSRRYSRLLERAAVEFSRTPRRSARHPANRPVGELAADAIRRRARALARSIERCRRSGDPDAVHGLRILGKKLRYTSEFFAPLVGRSFGKRVRKLTRFQDELGRLQDSIVAGQLAEELCEAALRDGHSAPYVSVLGQLRGRSRATGDAARQSLHHLLERLKVDALLGGLLADAKRLRRATQRARNSPA